MHSPIPLLERLIACPSVTPDAAGCYEVIAEPLIKAGFQIWRQTFAARGTTPVENFYARYGKKGKNLCFAGHVDVVPVGDMTAWNTPPFTPVHKYGVLYGRGASDMKGAVAAMVSALRAWAEANPEPNHSVSLLLTADEEGIAINGTKPMLAWLQEQGQFFDACIVGEPTSPSVFGEMAKIGRRGSLNGVLTIHGIQGHVAYPEKALNPNHLLLQVLTRLLSEPLDQGSTHFPASSLQITSIDVRNFTTNLIPATATARFNIRFNDAHTAESLTHYLHSRIASITPRYVLDLTCSGEAFLTPTGTLSDALITAVQKVTGKTPELSTTGGTSDARFIAKYCPVIEFGGVNATIHQVNECCLTEDMEKLADVYWNTMNQFFN